MVLVYAKLAAILGRSGMLSVAKMLMVARSQQISHPNLYHTQVPRSFKSIVFVSFFYSPAKINSTAYNINV